MLYLKGVHWLFDGVVQWNWRVPTEQFFSSTWRVFIDCPVWVALKGYQLIVWFVLYKKDCPLISWWCCAMKLKNFNRLFLVWYLKSVYWLSSVSCMQRIITDCLVLYLKSVHWSFDGVVQWNWRLFLFWYLKNVYWLSSTVLYLKRVNWSNIIIKCLLHPKKKFELFWVFWVC